MPKCSSTSFGTDPGARVDHRWMGCSKRLRYTENLEVILIFKEQQMQIFWVN